MERFAYLLETYPSLKIVLIVAVVAVVISLVGKLFRLAVGIIIFAFLISVGSTILLGDGTEYVTDVTKHLPEGYQEMIDEVYQDYRQKEEENSLFSETTKEDILERIRRAKEAGEELAKGPISPESNKNDSTTE